MNNKIKLILMKILTFATGVFIGFIITQVIK